MEANHRPLRSSVGVLIFNVVAAVVAITVNWPAQFGQVGTDAGAEFVRSATAISAPLIPVAALLVVALFAHHRGVWVGLP